MASRGDYSECKRTRKWSDLIILSNDDESPMDTSELSAAENLSTFFYRLDSAGKPAKSIERWPDKCSQEQQVVQKMCLILELKKGTATAVAAKRCSRQTSSSKLTARLPGWGQGCSTLGGYELPCGRQSAGSKPLRSPPMWISLRRREGGHCFF